ncbi:hypothetical protein AB0C59_10655 [Streptomyces sp. NPDC048664]|uniref:hypothetical protein n=1 Tax=Streptomyces sp. NPDC048664 TaxID=3154505 RepID=UPI003417226C
MIRDSARCGRRVVNGPICRDCTGIVRDFFCDHCLGVERARVLRQGGLPLVEDLVAADVIDTAERDVVQGGELGLHAVGPGVAEESARLRTRNVPAAHG